MKLRKALFGFVCLSSVLALAACGSDRKTTKKLTTIVKTTSSQTTTTQATTKKDVPAKYATNKATYDSFFNPATAEAAIAYNFTMDGVTKSEEYTTNITLKMADNRAVQLMNGTTPMAYQTYAVETDGSITVASYRGTGSGWTLENTISYASNQLVAFCCMNVAPVGFDFDKFTFNFETNTYETKEKVEFEYKMGESTYKFEISDYTIQFEDNKPVKIFFNRTQKMYNTDGELVDTFGGSMTITISNIGTTVVDPMATSSMS